MFASIHVRASPRTPRRSSLPSFRVLRFVVGSPSDTPLSCCGWLSSHTMTQKTAPKKPCGHTVWRDRANTQHNTTKHTGQQLTDDHHVTPLLSECRRRQCVDAETEPTFGFKTCRPRCSIQTPCGQTHAQNGQAQDPEQRCLRARSRRAFSLK